MIVVVNMKNIIQRGGIYYFRIVVPEDCVLEVGQTEIVESLRTKNPLEADERATPLRQKWKKAFKEVRNPSSFSDSISEDYEPIEDIVDWYQFHHRLMRKNLPPLLENKTLKEIRLSGEFYRDCASIIKNQGIMKFELPELELVWPMTDEATLGKTRKRNRALIKVLGEMRSICFEELDEPEKEVNHPVAVQAEASQTEVSIFKVAEQLLASKKRSIKTVKKVEAEVALFVEWLNGKTDVTKYTKDDLIDYLCNCLPNVPKNRNQSPLYKGVSIRKCVAMTKKNPNKYVPISSVTCENRLIALSMIFNFAKDYLGVIQVNPAKGIEVPKVRVIIDRPKAYTLEEVRAFWGALGKVRERAVRYPSHYWVPILCLYHGFRLNEACSLFLKDVYEDEDGVFVIDVNDVGVNKSVKNKSSVRVVPVHPFVLNDLGFRAFVESQKEDRSEGLLFREVYFVEYSNYQKGVSSWFGKWKKTWLPEESLYKNFHSLRHTFIHQAQNQAKMGDRCSQEITGHAVAGVSTVHLAYSGRLKPKDVLKELEKLSYGWEREPLVQPLPSPKVPQRARAPRKCRGRKSRKR